VDLSSQVDRIRGGLIPPHLIAPEVFSVANVTVDVQAIQECQNAGMTQAATAEKLGISLTAVCYHWQRQDSRGRPKGKGSNAIRIAALIGEGKTDREIADELGIAVSTANRQRRALLKSGN